jgi:hypothetical protein
MRLDFWSTTNYMSKYINETALIFFFFQLITNSENKIIHESSTKIVSVFIFVTAEETDGKMSKSTAVQITYKMFIWNSNFRKKKKCQNVTFQVVKNGRLRDVMFEHREWSNSYDLTERNRIGGKHMCSAWWQMEWGPLYTFVHSVEAWSQLFPTRFSLSIQVPIFPSEKTFYKICFFSQRKLFTKYVFPFLIYFH